MMTNLEMVKEKMAIRKGIDFLEEVIDTIEENFGFDTAYSTEVLDAVRMMNKTIGLPTKEMIETYLTSENIFPVCEILTGKKVPLRNSEVEGCGYKITAATKLLDDLLGSSEAVDTLIHKIMEKEIA